MKQLSLKIVLKRLGLSVAALPVYETLAHHGANNIADICRFGKIHRPAVYRGITELYEHGFIRRTEKGKRYLYRVAPESVIHTAFFKLEDAQATKSETEKNSNLSVTEYGGKNAVQSIFDDVIASTKRGDTFYRYTSEKNLEYVNSLLSPTYRKVRDAKRLERLVISNIASGSKKRKRLERFIKYLGSEAEPFEHNAIELLYADKIAFIDITASIGYVITNARLSEFQKTLFKALYRRL